MYRKSKRLFDENRNIVQGQKMSEKACLDSCLKFEAKYTG